MSTAAATITEVEPLRPPVSAALRTFCVLLAGCTFLLILAGSMVTSTGSGLSVPDWPTTYGQNMYAFPPSMWVGGIFYEHTHRLIASGVGLLTIVLCVWMWISSGSALLKWLSTLALVAVCLQGLLGGLTVIYKLPTWISVAHSGLAQLFFCLTVTIALLTSESWQRPAAQAGGTSVQRLSTWCRVVLLCVFLQILLGAVMRHTASGSAITDFPLSYGGLLPPVSTAALEPINDIRVWDQLLPEVTLAQVWIHFSHRLGGLLVGILVMLLASRVLRDFGLHKTVVLPTMLLLGLLVMQVVLGGMAVWSQRALFITTAHVGAGALMLATALVLVFQAHKLQLHSEIARVES
jgi:cytochrome c oxidase assembly protein subunit 15